MIAEQLLNHDPDPPEWRRSGHYFLLAMAIHVVILAWPRQESINMPLPGPISVKLIEAFRPRVEIPQPSPAKPPPEAAKPVASKARPILAMTPEQTPVTTSTPVVAAPPTPEPAPSRTIAAGSAPSATSPVVAARFDAAYLQNPRPNYPPLSRRLGEEGKVLLKVRVTSEGLAAAVNLEKSSNFERLDDAAQKAVARWRFVPAKRGDEAIEATVIVPIVFQLDS